MHWHNYGRSVHAVLPVALLAVAAPAIVLAVVVVSRRRLRAEAPAVPPALAAEAVALARRQRHRLTWALGTGAAAGLYCAAVQLGRPDLLGLPVLLAPVLAASTVLLVLLLAPATGLGTVGAGTRAADLAERRAWSFAPRWGFVLPASATVLLLAYLALTARLAAPDDGGRMRAYTLRCPDAGVLATATPYPGGFYGVPLASGAVLVVLLAALVLGRIARRARLGGPETFGLDNALRAAASRTVLGVATAGVLMPFGAVLVLGGGSGIGMPGHLDGECSAVALTVGGWTQRVAGLLLVVLGTGLAFAVPAMARTGLTAAEPESAPQEAPR
jgi:hypothetical protein